MSDVSNTDLMKVLLTVKQDIGGIKADIVSHAAAFKNHVEEDKELCATVKALELSAARAAGKRAAYAGLGGMVGAAFTLAVEFFRK